MSIFIKLSTLGLFFFFLGTVAFSQNKLPDTVELPVKEYTQKYPLSCEAAATSVALQYLGFGTSEDEVLGLLPYDKTPKTVDGQGNITWGDPDLGFVGDYDGVYLKTGYGIYSHPLAEAVKAKIKVHLVQGENLKLEELYQAVAAHHPVVVWVPTRFENVKPQTWKTPTGKTITWIEHEHAMVFRGYNKKENTVTLMDVHYGKYQTRTVAEFLRGWAYLGNQAVIFSLP